MTLRGLRDWLWPLIAIAGGALLAAGVVGWWAFYRGLYLEEQAALIELAETSAQVEYRRAGEVQLHELHEQGDLPPVPWSVPFVERVEFVASWSDSYEPESSPEGQAAVAARDRVLRLPGLKGYAGTPVDLEEWSAGVSEDDLPTKALPTLPTAKLLTGEGYAQTLERGVPVEADEREAIAARIAKSWNETRPVRTPAVRYEWKSDRSNLSRPVVCLTVVDGDRAFRFTTYEPAFRPDSYESSQLTFANDGEVHDYVMTKEGWRCFARFDALLPEAESLAALAAPPPDVDPYALDPGRGFPEATEFLGEQGANLAIVERIDDRRLFVQTRPFPRPGMKPLVLSAEVRSDLDFAIERYRIEEDPPVDRTDGMKRLTVWPFKGFEQEFHREIAVRRFDVQNGEPVIVERVSWRSDRADNTYPLHSLIAADFDPNYSESLFDPQAYGDVRPRPADLPRFRSYYAALAVGALLCVIALLGRMFDRLRERRPTNAGWMSSLRFGFASLLAASLLVISFAGWVKRLLDDARRQRAALDRIAAEDVRFLVDREGAGFPWALFSTESTPIGNPLRSVRIDHAPPSAEAIEPLETLWPPVRYWVDEGFSDYSLTFDDVEAAIGIEAPRIEKSEWTPEISLSGVVGTPLGGREREAAIDEAFAAWRRSRAAYPGRYLLREEIWVPDIAQAWMTVRDYERFWAIDLSDWAPMIECRDGWYRRRFRGTPQGWAPILREPNAGSDLAVSRPTAPDDADRRVPLPPFGDSTTRPEQTPGIEAALFRLTRADVLSVERLDENRLRLALRWPMDAGEREAPIQSWKIVVRSDLDGAVEACEYVESDAWTQRVEGLSRGVDPGELNTLPDAPARVDATPATVATLNRLVRVDGHVVLTAQAFERVAPRPDFPKHSYIARSEAFYAVQFDPRLPGPIFDRATVTSPDPPSPSPPSPLRWYHATAILGFAGLAYLGLRRIARALRLRRERQTRAADEASIAADAARRRASP